TRTDAAVERLDVAAYKVPTDEPESDGTLEWDSTTIVVVEAHAGGRKGLGYTYCDAAAAEVVSSQLAGVVEGEDVMDVRAAWLRMTAQVRNAGQPGIGFCAVSAVDQALWDLKARLLDVALVVLLGAAHDEVPIYGSGGFTSYSEERLCEQLGGWAEAGIPRVKMKVGREPERDPVRLDAAREAIGDDVELYVDANGAFARKEALAWAERYADTWGVTWLEEPVSSDDFEGLRLIRDSGPAGLEIAAGEYAYVPKDFRNIVGCVDCLQADVTRCGGITGLLSASGLANAHEIDISAHCAPAISAHAFCAVERRRHLEYFHDHVRIEGMLFDGAPEPDAGVLRPDRSRPGNGLELKRREAERLAA
ncbi:MAG TPA: enolase C-terminal domain-like protein, partial [Gaiellaceae bacterium]|nr:enolase C-terminal domain-like protein [Gaiellaceae bacterium]